MTAARLASLAAALALAAAPLAANDGELDASFGVLPGVTFRTGGSNSIVFAGGALAPDGRIFAVGDWDDPGTAQAPLLSWAEFDRDGAPTISCDAGMNGPIPGVSQSHLAAAHVTAAGKILVAGTAYLAASPTVSRALVAQIDPGGSPCTLDDTFNFDGWDLFEEPAFCASASCAILDTAAIRTSTGAVPSELTILLLRANTGFLTSRFFVVALETTGYLHTAFGDAGFAELAAPGLGELLGAGARLDVDPRGRVWVLAARFDPGTASDTDMVLARFTPEGVLDASFDGDGIALVDDDAATDDAPVALAVHSDLGVSLAYKDLTDGNLLVICYRPAAGGQSCGTQGPTDYRDLAAQGDGKLLATYDSGGPSYSLAVTRSIPPFAGDDTFGANGPGTTLVEINLGGADDEAPRALVLGDGRPLVFGVADDAAGTAGIVVRLTNAYLFADGFEAGTTGGWSAAAGLP